MSIRVGFWSPVLWRAGGTETWHQTLIEGLSEAPGIEVAGLAVVDDDGMDPVRADSIRQYCPVEGGSDAMRHVAGNSDVLIMWGLGIEENGQGPIIQWLPPRGQRPVTVFVSHGDGNSEYTRLSAEASEPDIDIFVGVSQAAVEAFPEHCRATAAVLHNGVDPERLKPTIDRDEQRRRWGILPGKKILGCVARLSEEKDPFALTRAISALPEEWVGVHIGDGDRLEHTKAFAAVNAPLRVYFPGPMLDVGNAYNAIDVLLCPSKQEGFGLSIVEGWFSERPVVSTLVGIARELWASVDPVLVDAPGREIAAAVLCADGRTPESLIRRRQRQTCQFSSDAFVNRWAQFLKEALCRSAVPA